MSKYKILDSHIHLYSLANIPLLHWDEGNPLHGNRRLDEYIENSQSTQFDVEGVVWIECDAKIDLTQGLKGLENPIEEYLYICRNINGKLLPEEGVLTPFKRRLIKAMITFAPMPLGSAGVEEYVKALKTRNSSEFHLVKGFRYLIQDKPPLTISDPHFVSSFQWLDSNGYVFDLGIDMRSGGLWQFKETLEVFKKVPNLKYIINHLTKPCLDFDPETIDSNPDFLSWKRLVTEMYITTPNSYMKLSGGFSEVEQDVALDVTSTSRHVYPWFKVVYELWGPERTIFASNWPVCAIPAGQNLTEKWFQVCETLFDSIGMDEDTRRKIYYSNAFKAYNI